MHYANVDVDGCVHKPHPPLGFWFALNSDGGNPSTSVPTALQVLYPGHRVFYRVDAPSLM